jgi:serine/threonine protein kinase/WD40 repeat protein
MHANHETVEALFNQARQLAPAERPVFLAKACGNDTELRRRLEELLNAEAKAGAFLPESPQETATLKSGQPEDSPDEAVGQTLGRYKLLERVGEGGCGVVYVAEQTEPVRRRVALKVIKLGMDTKQVVARFEAERQALAMMDHPNIAKVLDAGTTDLGRPYFVMELVRGIKITEYCDQSQLSTKDRVELFIKVCQAIQHAHQKGIIHRDIKPSNVLVTLHDGAPVPKVIDFGIAKATEGRLTDNTVYTQLHQFIGTPAYMSPEQAEMSGLDIDTRSDIYSLGVLLYEILAGSTPFDAKELMESGIDAMRKTIREKEPPRPSTKLATLHGEDQTATAKRRSVDTSKLANLLRGDLDWIVMKCLEKDRARRYDTANGLAADLRRHLNNELVVARPPSASYRFQKAFRRNKVTFLAGSAVAAAILLGFIVSSWQAMRATDAKTRAIASQKEAEKARGAESLQRQAAEAARVQATDRAAQAARNLYAADMKAVDQYIREGSLGAANALLTEHIPRIGEPDLRGWEWRYFRRMAEGDHPTILRGHSNDVAKVQFSPDGRYLASRDVDSRLLLWDLQPSPSPHRWSPPQAIRDFGFAHDGRLGLVTEDGRLTLVSFGERMAETGVLASPVQRVVFSPASDYAAIERFGNTVAWLDLSNKTARPLFGGQSVNVKSVSDDGSMVCARSASGWKGFVVDSGTDAPVWEGNLPPSNWGMWGEGSAPPTFLPGGAGLLVGSLDSEPQYLSLGTGQMVPAFATPESGLTQFVHSRQGDLLAGSSFNHHVSLWTLPDRKPIRRLYGHQGEVSCVAISPDGRIVASGGQDRLVMLWSREDARARQDSELGISGVMNQSAFIPEGRRVAVLDPSQSVVRICDLETRQVTATLRDAGFPVRFESGGEVLVTLATNRIQYWSVADGKVRATIPLAAPAVTDDPNWWEEGKIVCARDVLFRYSDRRRQLERLSLTTGEILGDPIPGRPEGWKQRTRGLAISSDGRLLAFGEGDLELWDISSVPRRQALIPTGQTRLNWTILFSPDDRLLATIGIDATIKLWDVATGANLHTLHGHKRGIFCGTFSPDGRTLVTGSHDHTIKLWNVSTGREVASLDVPWLPSSVCFSPDGRFLVSSSQTTGTTVRVWQAPSWDELQAAEPKDPASSHLGGQRKAVPKQP